MPTTTMTANELRALPAAVDIVTAGRVLGLSRNTAYGLARRGEFPAPVLRVGQRWRVPTAGLLDLLGVDRAPAA